MVLSAPQLASSVPVGLHDTFQALSLWPAQQKTKFKMLREIFTLRFNNSAYRSMIIFTTYVRFHCVMLSLLTIECCKQAKLASPTECSHSLSTCDNRITTPIADF